MRLGLSLAEYQVEFEPKLSDSNCKELNPPGHSLLGKYNKK